MLQDAIAQTGHAQGSQLPGMLQVRAVVAPAVLAAYALSLGDPGNTALGIFGIYLSIDLKVGNHSGSWQTDSTSHCSTCVRILMRILIVSHRCFHFCFG